MGRIEEFGFQNVRLRTHQAKQSGHFGDATGPGNQAKGNFRQSKLNFLVVHCNPVMANQGHFPTTTERRPIDTTHHRHAQRFQSAEVFLHGLDFSEDLRAIRCLGPHQPFEVCTREEGGLVGREHDASDCRLVGEHLGRDDTQVFLPIQAHGVDG